MLLPTYVTIFATSKVIDINQTNNNHKKLIIMNQSIVLTPHVLNTINSLPEEERIAITCALAGEMILGNSSDNGLTPEQSLIYTIIRDYIRRDSHRFRHAG